MTELAVKPNVTTGPIPYSTKHYPDLDEIPGAKVPFRRVNSTA